MTIETLQPAIAARTVSITYNDNLEQWDATVHEYTPAGDRQQVRPPSPIPCQGYTDERLQSAVDEFARELHIEPAEFELDELDFTAVHREDFGRLFRLQLAGTKYWFDQVAAHPQHFHPFGWNRVKYWGTATSARTAAAEAAMSEGQRIGCPVSFKLIRPNLYFAQPLETVLNCPCGETIEIGLTVCPLSQKLGYDTHQTCGECGRSSAHQNSRTGEVYSWITPAADRRARDIMERMEADADDNAFGRNAGW